MLTMVAKSYGFTETPLLAIGYAETSTRRDPKEPETVIVGEEEILRCYFEGQDRRDGHLWNRWKQLGKTRFYWQLAVC